MYTVNASMGGGGWGTRRVLTRCERVLGGCSRACKIQYIQHDRNHVVYMTYGRWHVVYNMIQIMLYMTYSRWHVIDGAI